MQKSEIEKSQKFVAQTVHALEGFFNPFTVEDKNSLYCISSGQKMPTDIATDVLNAEESGKKEKLIFIEKKL